MTGRIYLLNENSTLVAMEEAPYDSERLLQEMLAAHPDLLAGEQINSDEPRRWLLVTREMSVAGEENGVARWSLDHLFLDQDAVPTLVEVKRSSDTRIRREVVGQMLDYAANAVVYWPVEEIRAKFESRCERDGDDPHESLVALTGETQEIDEYWQKVKTNLQAGRVRLIFLADSIPAELRRVVEFLNEQMDPAEVLAIEVRQFIGQGMKTLVPRVLGQTETARQKKKPVRGESKQWDEPSFFGELQRRAGEDSVAVARQCLKWARERGLRVYWGKGTAYGSLSPMYINSLGRHSSYVLWTNGRVELQFQHITNTPPFDQEQNRLELARRISAINGVSIPADAVTRRPAFDLEVLIRAGALDTFLGVFDWMFSEMKRAEGEMDTPPAY